MTKRKILRIKSIKIQEMLVLIIITTMITTKQNDSNNNKNPKHQTSVIIK